MTKDQFIEWALALGWQQDRYGHLQRHIGSTVITNHYRFKLSRIAVRYEVKSEGNSGWTRLSSGYYSKLSISDDGKLQGMVR